MILISCTTNKHYARWNARLVDYSNLGSPFTYWQDGIQFLEMSKDSIQVDIHGVKDDRYIYIFVSVRNNSENVLTIFPAKLILIQNQKRKDIKLTPKLPKKIRKLGQSKSSLIAGLYAISIAANSYREATSQTNTEKAYYKNQKENRIMEHEFVQQKLQQSEKDIISIMLKNQTILPGKSYSGFLLFAHQNKGFQINNSFYLGLIFGDTKFLSLGKLVSQSNFDELDLPKDLDAIQFN